MDLYVGLQIIIVLVAIFLGVRLGGMGIGYAGGLGVVFLTLGMGMNPGQIPWDVILIIMSAIAAICALQLAGGLGYLVGVAERILRSNPKHINYLAPTVTYVLTLLAGTGHTAFSMIPVIVEVSKSENIKPSVPLSIAVVASQIGITASPVSAAVIAMSGFLEPYGVSYPMLLAICIPTTYAACMITAFIMSTFLSTTLSDDPVYQERLAHGYVMPPKSESAYQELPATAKRSVLIFLIGIIAIVAYATAITLFCHIDTARLVEMSTFKSGLSACVCVLGVAWLGDTFVKGHIPEIKTLATQLVLAYPFLLAVALFFASMLLYSQAATTQALIPTVILAMGITANDTSGLTIIIASFSAVSALFVLPTYPTLLGAVQMDDTGSTRIGKYIFNHPFFFPGVVTIVIAVALGFVVAPMLLP